MTCTLCHCTFRRRHKNPSQKTSIVIRLHHRATKPKQHLPSLFFFPFFNFPARFFWLILPLLHRSSSFLCNRLSKHPPPRKSTSTTKVSKLKPGPSLSVLQHRFIRGYIYHSTFNIQHPTSPRSLICLHFTSVRPSVYTLPYLVTAAATSVVGLLLLWSVAFCVPQVPALPACLPACRLLSYPLSALAWGSLPPRSRGKKYAQLSAWSVPPYHHSFVIANYPPPLHPPNQKSFPPHLPCFPRNSRGNKVLSGRIIDQFLSSTKSCDEIHKPVNLLVSPPVPLFGRHR